MGSYRKFIKILVSAEALGESEQQFVFKDLLFGTFKESAEGARFIST